MLNRHPGDVTVLLRNARVGDANAEAQLVEIIYPELRRRARQFMRHERGHHTLQPTALVNEAYIRLVGKGVAEWEDRSHFYAVASQVMRRVLVDYARRAGAVKHGGEAIRVELDEVISCKSEDLNRIIEVDRALRVLKTFDPRAAAVVEQRFFGGCTEDEIAESLGCGVRTVKRDWDFAKAWLRRYLTESPDSEVDGAPPDSKPERATGAS